MTMLQTPRLSLRQWTRDDFEPVAAFLQDGEQTRHLGSGRKSRAEAWDWFCATAGEWVLTGRGMFALEMIETRALAGWCGLWHPVDLDEPELAWSLFPSAQGHGLATEAARRVQRWAAEDLGLPPLFSFVHPNNNASRNLAERLGATVECETTFRDRPRLVYRHRIPQNSVNI
ncbi:MAG: GNAT family N-acetyltransferase [Hyphomicrobiaceae bacterium]